MKIIYCTKMKTIVRDKKVVMEKLLTSMYESVCTQKELLELLLEGFKAETTNLNNS